ncbi:MAG: hypothetical protein COC06_11775 [Bacteroidales bacterium]|nr:MAG: hypothetical protein COC06_11775 [Bacteroidales bacterium]
MELNCDFQTERLKVSSWQLQNKDIQSKQNFAERIIKILTPAVTKSLPEDWQNINSLAKADNRRSERKNECEFSAVNLSFTNELIGFIFLYNFEDEKGRSDLRFGYLLAENVWENGLGSELIRELIAWCEKNEKIKSLSGGVEKENKASIKVLEKTGFSQSALSTPSDKVIFYEKKFTR